MGRETGIKSLTLHSWQDAWLPALSSRPRQGVGCGDPLVKVFQPPLALRGRPQPGRPCSSLSPGLLQMQLILHYDETYREVKYGNMGLPDIDSKMLIGINVTPIAALLYTPVLIRCTRLSPRGGASP